MKKYFIIALLLHGMLFFKLSLPTVTKDLDTKDNLLKQSVPVTFTQVAKAVPVTAPPQPVVEAPKPKEIPKKEVKPEAPKPLPKKTVPKKDVPKKEVMKEPEVKEIKEVKETTPAVVETPVSNTTPSVDNLLTANADGTYNAVSNHGIKYKITREIPPVYPKQAENIRYRKKVVVKAKFLVDQSGNVKNISIINSHSKLGFDQAVIDALGKWKFSPIVYNGKVISVYFQKEFVFEPKS